MIKLNKLAIGITIFCCFDSFIGCSNSQLLSTRASTDMVSPSYHFVNKLVDSSDNGYEYGYGPSIIYHQSKFHMFYCSSGLKGGWDAIRYVSSQNGRVWTAPHDVLVVSDLINERAACDPSVVHFQAAGDSAAYYYLFYSGNAKDIQTVMFVARSRFIDGPYQKWTMRKTWEINPKDPQIIMRPRTAKPDCPDPCASPWYGAGQQTVAVKNGILYSWYHDDTAYSPERREKIFFSSTTDPVFWSEAKETNVENNSVDIKYDPVTEKFIMFETISGHSQDPQLARRLSSDGLNWSPPEIICGKDCFIHYSNNLGISGDREGRMISDAALIVYGAPYDLNRNYRNECVDPHGTSRRPYCWGYWDLYGSVINPAGNVWNDIPWGWAWTVGTHYQLALGDYDGDGKTDRAFIDRSTSQWFVICSQSGNGCNGAIPWGVVWDGMDAHHQLALGDYDGDRKTDRAIIDPVTGRWYIIGSAPFQIYQ